MATSRQRLVPYPCNASLPDNPKKENTQTYFGQNKDSRAHPPVTPAGSDSLSAKSLSIENNG